MPNKDKIDKAISDWSLLLEGLNEPKYKLYKYTRIYENIVKNNDKKDYKFLLSIAYRIFKEAKDLKLSRSSREEVIIEYEDADFYIGDSLIVDSLMSFCDAVAKMILEKIKDDYKINYIKIEKKGNNNIVKLYY